MATQPTPHDHRQMHNWANANHNRPIPDQITGDTTLCADRKPSDDKATAHMGGDNRYSETSFTQETQNDVGHNY